MSSYIYSFESVAKLVQEGCPIGGDLGDLFLGVGAHDGVIYISILSTVCKGMRDPVAALDCALVRVGNAEGSLTQLAPVLTVLSDHLQGHFGEGAGTLVSICQTWNGKISQGVLGITILSPHKKLQWVAALAYEDLLNFF